MAGKAGGMPRIMNGFMDEVHIEGGSALHQRQQKSLVEGQDIETKESEQE